MPTCLFTFPDTNETFGEAMGWGAKSFGGETSDELLKGVLKFIPNTECNENYSEDTDNLPGGILSSQICAGDPSRQKDTW